MLSLEHDIADLRKVVSTGTAFEGGYLTVAAQNQIKDIVIEHFKKAITSLAIETKTQTETIKNLVTTTNNSLATQSKLQEAFEKKTVGALGELDQAFDNRMTDIELEIGKQTNINAAMNTRAVT